MRWGNSNEMIEQNAQELVKFINEKIENPKKDINILKVLIMDIQEKKRN